MVVGVMCLWGWVGGGVWCVAHIVLFFTPGRTQEKKAKKDRKKDKKKKVTIYVWCVVHVRMVMCV